MKKSLIFLLLTWLLMLSCAFAQVSLPDGLSNIGDSAFQGDKGLKGRLVLPDSVQTVGDLAFAGTGLHALVVPAGAASVSGSVLKDTSAAYLYLNGAQTAIKGSVSGAAYVFGPAFGSASNLSNFYAAETLVVKDGIYYSVTDGSAVPLCAVDGTAVGTEITVAKLVNGQPVRSLDTLVLDGCTNLSTIHVPNYLEGPAGLDVRPYAAMTASAPATDAADAAVGQTITWTTEVSGAYGAVNCQWRFTTDGSVREVETTEPSVTFTLVDSGDLTVSVTVGDELGDIAEATSPVMTVSGSETVYRALLIGNTYPGTSLALPGCDNDVAGMKSMLSRMTATPYRVTTRSNLSADGIESAILSAFSGATVNDVSLFYFSGHGQNAFETSYHGALVGTGSTYLTVARLKSILDQVPGKKVVIIDSCHSGAMIGRSADSAATVSQSELKAFNSKVITAFSAQTRGTNDLANSGYYVITAAHSLEEAINMGYDADGDGILEKQFGLFTYMLTQGSGWNIATNKARSLSADSDSNGEITLHEAYSYARYKALQSNPNQTAQVYPSNSTLVIWGK